MKRLRSVAAANGRLLLAVMVGGLWIGCAVESGPGSEGPTGGAGGKADNPADGDGGVANDAGVASEDAAVPLPELAPSYGVYVESKVKTRNRETGETTTYTVSVTGLVTVAQEDAAATLTFKPCRAVLPAAGGYQPTVKDSVVRSADPVTIEGTLAPGDPVAFATDQAALQLGVRLTNPLTDPLPTSGGSSKVRDQDGDGNPGVTIQASGWSIYVGIRVVFSLDGALDEHGHLVGSAELDPDYAVYGDNVPFVNVASEIASAQANSQVISKVNRFKMVPTEDATGTCAEVVATGFFD
jgi:hypothetical protein